MRKKRIPQLSILAYKRALFCFLIFFLLVSNGATAGFAEDENKVLENFKHFSHAWMAKLSQLNDQNQKNIRIESSNGWYTGQYICYGDQCRFRIKKTVSKKTPYIGFLSYSEMRIQKAGRTKRQAVNDPGRVYHEIPVTEIFRYTDNHWVY